jgi:hypothetical protein
MFAPVRDSKTHFPFLGRWPWQFAVTLRDHLGDTAPGALPARTTPAPLTSGARSSPVFPLIQRGAAFRFLRFVALLFAHVGLTYTTPERTFGNLLRIARRRHSTPMLYRPTRVVTLLFCVALFSSSSHQRSPGIRLAESHLQKGIAP